MNLTHFPALLLFALVVSVAFAVLSRNTWRERLRYAVWALLAFVAVAVALGYLMLLLPR